jgi:hypothetical protein
LTLVGILCRRYLDPARVGERSKEVAVKNSRASDFKRDFPVCHRDTILYDSQNVNTIHV